MVSRIQYKETKMLTWCNSWISLASSLEEHFGSSVVQYFSAFSIHGISCWLRFWYVCQWATLPVSAELRSFAREHRLSHWRRTLDNLVFRAEVSLERKFWDIPLASFSKFSRVTWFSATSQAIVYQLKKITWLKKCKSLIKNKNANVFSVHKLGHFYIIIK